MHKYIVNHGNGTPPIATNVASAWQHPLPTGHSTAILLKPKTLQHECVHTHYKGSSQRKHNCQLSIVMPALHCHASFQLPFEAAHKESITASSPLSCQLSIAMPGFVCH